MNCSGQNMMVKGGEVEFSYGVAYSVCIVCGKRCRAWREGGNNGTGPWLAAAHRVKKEDK